MDSHPFPSGRAATLDFSDGFWKKPLQDPLPRPKAARVGKGLSSGGGCGPPGGRAEPSHSRGRRGGRRPRPPGLGARGGAAGGRERHPSSRTSRRFLTERGGGEGEGHGPRRRPSREPCSSSPSPARPVGPLPPPPPTARSLGAGSRGPWARRQLCGRRGRGSSRCACECAGQRRPPGGSSGKRDEEKEGASAPRGQGGRGPSRRRLSRPKLRRGCAQDAFERRSGRPPDQQRGLALGLRLLSPARALAAAFAYGGAAAAAAASRPGWDPRAPEPAAGAGREGRGARPPLPALPRVPGAGF